MYVAGLEIHHNDLEIVTQVIILIVLESGFLHRPLFHAFRHQQTEYGILTALTTLNQSGYIAKQWR